MKVLPGTSTHVYSRGVDNTLNTRTPTYDAIVRADNNIVPEGKRTCILRPNAGSFFKYQFTRNAKIPPALFIHIDKLKRAQNVRSSINGIRQTISPVLMDFNQRSEVHHGGTVLHAAAAAYDVENPEQVPAGLMNVIASIDGIDLRARNRFGQTALHVAASSGSREAAQELLNRDIGLHALVDKKGKTAFEVAILSGRKGDEVKYCLYENDSTGSYNAWKPTILKDAVGNGHRYTMRDLKNLLKNRELDINYRFPAPLAPDGTVLSEQGGETVLHAAVSAYKQLNHLHEPHRRGLISLLLGYSGIDPNLGDNQGRTALHHAVLHESVAALNELLAKESVDINKQDATGKTPLLYALSNYSQTIGLEHINNSGAINALLRNRNVNLAAVDNQGRGVFHHAAMQRWPHYRVLLNRLPDNAVNRTDMHGRTPFHYAVESDFLDFVRHAVSGRDGIYTGVGDNQGQNPLHIAVLHRRLEIMALLLDSEAVRVNAQDSEGRTPFHFAVANRISEVAVALLQNMNVNVNIPGLDRDTPLHTAIHNNLIDVVRGLIGRRDIDINVQGRLGRTPLHVAAATGQDEIVRLLLDKSEESVNRGDVNEQTPLHLATQNANLSTVEELLKSPAITPDIQDANGRSALDLAARNASFHESFVNAYNRLFASRSGDSRQQQEQKGDGTKPSGRGTEKTGRGAAPTGPAEASTSGVRPARARSQIDELNDFATPMSMDRARAILGITPKDDPLRIDIVAARKEAAATKYSPDILASEPGASQSDRGKLRRQTELIAEAEKYVLTSLQENELSHPKEKMDMERARTILGITKSDIRTVTDRELASKKRELFKRFHPDRVDMAGSGMTREEATEKAKLISEAEEFIKLRLPGGDARRLDEHAPPPRPL